MNKLNFLVVALTSFFISTSYGFAGPMTVTTNIFKAEPGGLPELVFYRGGNRIWGYSLIPNQKNFMIVPDSLGFTGDRINIHFLSPHGLSFEYSCMPESFVIPEGGVHFDVKYNHYDQSFSCQATGL